MAFCLVRATVRSMEQHQVAGTAIRTIPTPAGTIHSESATAPASMGWVRNARSNSAYGSCFKPLFFLQGHQTWMLVAFSYWGGNVLFDMILRRASGRAPISPGEDNPMFRLSCLACFVIAFFAMPPAVSGQTKTTAASAPQA